MKNKLAKHRTVIAALVTGSALLAAVPFFPRVVLPPGYDPNPHAVAQDVSPPEPAVDLLTDPNGDWLMLSLDNRILGRYDTKGNCEEDLQAYIKNTTHAYEHSLKEKAPADMGSDMTAADQLQAEQSAQTTAQSDQVAYQQNMTDARETICTE
jgi:hypothetical protein